MYRIHGVGPCEARVLRAAFFEEREGAWVKAFDRRALVFEPDLGLLRRNFERHLRREAAGPPSAAALADALEWICDAFGAAGVDWWLVGSGALFVRGLDVHPHDLDVMVGRDQLGLLAGVVRPHAVEPFHHVGGWVVRGFGVIDVGCRVDVACDPEDWVDAEGPVDFGPAAAAALEAIDWRGRSLRVPPLAYHLGPNRARGRHALVEAIERRSAGG